MRNLFALVTVLGLVGFGSDPANADLILFSNFSPADGNGFNEFSGVSVSGAGSEYNAQAMPFTPSATANLGSIDIALFWVNFGGSTATGIVRLYNDGGSGVPGSALESFNVTTSGGPTPLHVTSALNPVLTSGTQYWLAALPFEDNSSMIWHRNSSGQTDIPAYSGDGTTWTAADPPPQDLMAFRINGPAVVPEPSSLSLLAVAAAWMAGYRPLRARSRGRPASAS
ncbi:MAG: hypothetical protein HZA91_14895 [Verrucomicrobia bacterium]|nr:hypothetical protein [Verrucomicrobiota bacterium]